MYLKKKIFNLTVFFTLIVLASLPVMSISTTHAAEASPAAYQPGTSYSNSHSVNQAINFINDEPELNARYIYYPYCDVLQAQVYYIIYPHKVSDFIITESCAIQNEMSYTKRVWFQDKVITDTTSKTLSNLELIEADEANGYYKNLFDGPKDKPLVGVKTILTFNDAEYGSCTWTITGS